MASHDQVAHAWAHQTGRQTRGSSMSYSGPTLYSYGTAIARHVIAADGASAVLFTTARFSSSSSAHQNLARDACGHLRTFEVPNVNASTAAHHAANREAFITLAIDCVKRAGQARTQAASLTDAAHAAVEQANAYAAAFGVDVRPATFENLDDLAAEAERRAADQRETEALARRQRDAAERLSMRDRVRAWMRGEPIYVRTRTPMVRVVGDRVETTWGASATLADALAAYRVAQACRRSGRGVKGPQVDHWGTAQIDGRGNIKVGCHSIPFRLAQLAACLAGLERPTAEARA